MEYYIKNEENVNSLELRVLAREGKGLTIPVLPIKVNEAEVLYYLDSHMDTLADCMNEITEEELLELLKSLFSKLIRIKETGFLSFQTISAETEKMYVDLVQREVYFTCYPVSPTIYHSEKEFYETLRTALLRGISERKQIQHERLSRVEQLLKATVINFSEILEACQKHEMRKQLFFSGKDEDRQLNIPICSYPFTIGKKKLKNDFALSDYPMISRMHCRIDTRDDRTFITDLNSANGTFVNFQRIESGKMHEIREGDIVRLANLDFSVGLREVVEG